MHSTEENKVIMTIQERILIMKSSICDEKTNLKKVLSLFDKSIKEKDLQKIKDIDIESFQLIKTKDSIEEMKNSASKEWKQNSHNGKIEEPCQLCGNPKSEDKYTIINKENNNTLLVGTSCIHKFSELDDKLNGVPIDQYSRYAKADPKKLNRIIYFNNSICTKGKDIFSIWRNKYEKFNILFPKEYDIKFTGILKKSKHIYNSYINGKISEKQVENFKKWIDEFNYLYKKCEKFYNDYKDDKYICTRRIAKFLLKNGLEKTLEYIQRSGRIKKEIAKYVCHSDFVNRFRNNIRKTFLKHKIELNEIKDSSILLSYKYEQFETIFLEISLKNFTQYFYCMFYDDIKYTRAETFSELNIYNNYDSIDNFLGILNKCLKRTQYKFVINGKLYKNQEVELQKRDTEQYTIIKLINILKNYMYVFYFTKVNTESKLLNYIRTIKIWNSKSDKDKYDIGNISKEWSTD